MRLWSLHPKYLDPQGLVALWRESLLAQKVLEGKTKGYTKHPQLERFRKSGDPLGTVGCYLHYLWEEAARRGYSFAHEKIAQGNATAGLLTVSTGQMEYEFVHLRRKLEARSPDWMAKLAKEREIEAHPLFRVLPGPVEIWEKTRSAAKGTARHSSQILSS